jgi:tRNA G18 (ribose-2'-O)-methylase SpoU
LTDLSRLPRLTASARAALEAAAEGRDGFLLEGTKAIGDALRAEGLRVRRVWLSESLPAREAETLLEAAARASVPAGVASARDLGRASATVTPQGALAVVDDAGVAPQGALARRDRPALLLDGVQDPGNVGAVLRVAAAFDVSGVLATEGCAHPLGAKALRASAGAALVVPFARAPVGALLAAVAASGRPLWLLDARGDDLFAVEEAPEGVVLAVGSEGRGASAAVSGAAARRVAIPLSAKVESLNAAVAVGIATALLVRARR